MGIGIEIVIGTCFIVALNYVGIVRVRLTYGHIVFKIGTSSSSFFRYFTVLEAFIVFELKFNFRRSFVQFIVGGGLLHCIWIMVLPAEQCLRVLQIGCSN